MPLFTFLIRIAILAILWQHKLTGCVPLEDALDPEPHDPMTTPADNMSPHLIKYNMDPEHLQRYFAFLPTEVVAPTMEATTQHAPIFPHNVMRRFYESPFPALNVARRNNEDLLTDVVYCL